MAERGIYNLQILQESIHILMNGFQTLLMTVRKFLKPPEIVYYRLRKS